MLSLDEIFACVTVKIKDKSYPLEFTLQSLTELKEYGIDIGVLGSYVEPDILSKMIHCAIPQDMKKHITVKELAATIPYGEIQFFVDKLVETLKKGVPDNTEVEDDKKKRQACGTGSYI